MFLDSGILQCFNQNSLLENIRNCNRKYVTKSISNVSRQKSKCVRSGRMSLVDPREFLSRNDSAAAGGRGVALQSVLELISAEDWGVQGWSPS